MSGWRPVLRLARRDALRAKGRSLLVVLMIALPVAGVTWVDVLWRTDQLTPDQVASRELGRADAVVTDSGLTRVDQFGGASGPERPPGAVDLAAALPAGSRTLLERSTSARVGNGERSTSADLRELAYDDPLAAGLYTQVQGRAPRAGEVALTEGLAERLGVGVGDRVGVPVPDRHPVQARVVGLVGDGSSHDAKAALLPPGTLPASGTQLRLLVDVPGEMTYGQVRELNAQGLFVRGRQDHFPGQPPSGQTSGSGTSAGTVTALVLVAGMALLEVVLLAGPAFAVGARRSSRQLALLSATGAQRRDVRRVVLAGGVVLGLAGGVVGAVTGVLLAWATLPLVARLRPTVLGPFDVRALDLLVIAGLGVVTALLAALLPALSASRQDVVAGLTGRRGTVRGSRRTPVLGALATALGAAVALVGAQRSEIVLVLAGSVLAELGLVATTPALVGLAGRLGPHLPAAPRLALRDASRNRSRTAPAVAAVLAAVAGTVAVSTFVVSLDRHDEQNYRPQALPGTALQLTAGDPAASAEAVAALRAELPAREVVEVRRFGGPGDEYVEVRRAEAERCPAELLPPGAGLAAYERTQSDPRCSDVWDTGFRQLSGNVVGGPDVLRALTGRTDPALLRTLTSGGVLVVDPQAVGADGRARVVVEDANGRARREVRLPAAVLPEGARHVQVFSPAVARVVDQPLETAAAVAVLDRPPTPAERDAAQRELDRLGLDQDLYVERGYQSSYGLGLVALAVASAVLVLGASGIATGLAAEDGRRDLSTLAAVGATPGLRRLLAGAQSAVTAGLGTALGVVAGLVPAVGMLLVMNATARRAERFEPGDLYPVVLPWQTLLVTAVVVPALAAGVAMALTRSRLPLLRRTA